MEKKVRRRWRLRDGAAGCGLVKHPGGGAAHQVGEAERGGEMREGRGKIGCRGAELECAGRPAGRRWGSYALPVARDGTSPPGWVGLEAWLGLILLFFMKRFEGTLLFDQKKN
jgi:hypothetical protein